MFGCSCVVEVVSSNDFCPVVASVLGENPERNESEAPGVCGGPSHKHRWQITAVVIKIKLISQVQVL